MALRATAHDVRKWCCEHRRVNRVDNMAHRTFRDRSGLEWQVWDVIPSKFVGATLDGGWLTFLAGDDKRRLAPVPLYWLSASEDELVTLLESAKAVNLRAASPPAGETPVAEDRV